MYSAPHQYIVHAMYMFGTPQTKQTCQNKQLFCQVDTSIIIVDSCNSLFIIITCSTPWEKYLSFLLMIPVIGGVECRFVVQSVALEKAL